MPRKRKNLRQTHFDKTDLMNAVAGKTFIRAHGKTAYWTNADLALGYQKDAAFRAAVVRELDVFNSCVPDINRRTFPGVVDTIAKIQADNVQDAQDEKAAKRLGVSLDKYIHLIVDNEIAALAASVPVEVYVETLVRRGL